MLLCDVALGNMYEARKAEYIEKLPTGFHSTKGLGKTAPDTSNVKEIDGATVVAFHIDSLYIIFYSGPSWLWSQEFKASDRLALQ